MEQPEITLGLAWATDPAFRVKGPLSEVVKLIPRFERIPCGWGLNENPYSDWIYRMPLTHYEEAIPVAMVSKTYALIQHTDVVSELVSVLQANSIPTTHLHGTLILSELGQRMCLTVDLPDFWVEPKDRHKIGLQVNCYNSVDYTLSLKLRLGWFRYVCQNGMVFGKTFSYSKRNHFALTIQDFNSMFTEQIESYEEEKAELLNWQSIPITLEQVFDLADGKIALEWGVHAAARVCHIAETGCDGTVKPGNPKLKLKPHEHKVTNVAQVPGFSQLESAFDLLQVLSWIAGNTRNLQDQMNRTSQINAFMQVFKPQHSGQLRLPG